MVWVYINKPQYLNLNCQDQNWTQPSMCGLTSTKRRGIITSVSATKALWMQPRIQFDFVAAAVLCCLRLSLLSPGQQGCSQPHRSQLVLGFLVVASQHAIAHLALQLLGLYFVTDLGARQSLWCSLSHESLSQMNFCGHFQFGLFNDLILKILK